MNRSKWAKSLILANTRLFPENASNFKTLHEKISSSQPTTSRFSWRFTHWICHLAFFALIYLSACINRNTDSTANDENHPPTNIRLALNWFPEAEHGGFLAAEVHGYFREEGLQVEILPGRPDVPVQSQVGTKRVEFAISDASEVLLARDQNVPIVAVMAGLQTNPRCLLVHQKSNISHLNELKDLTLAVSVREPFFHFLKNNYPLTNVRIVPYTGSLAPFLQNNKYAQQAYVFSEPFIAEKQGAKTRCILLAEQGFNPYASMLITHEDMIARHPELVKKFVRASVRGWEHYLRDPKPTNQHIHKINPQMDIDILSFGAASIVPLVQPQATDAIGAMKSERWQLLYEQMVKLQLIESKPQTIQKAFVERFLPST